MTAFFYIFLFLFLGVSLFLCFIILMQESKSLGLGSSFGGESGDSLFGTSTAQVLKKITTYLAFIFMLASIILSLWTSSIGRRETSSIPVQVEEANP